MFTTTGWSADLTPEEQDYVNDSESTEKHNYIDQMVPKVANQVLEENADQKLKINELEMVLAEKDKVIKKLEYTIELQNNVINTQRESIQAAKKG